MTQAAVRRQSENRPAIPAKSDGPALTRSCAMTLVFIDQDKLSVSKTNMRYGKKAPDVSDMLPTVRKRGIIQTLLVRPNCQDGHYEIVAGARRFHAARIVAAETGEAEPLPCRILSETDDAAAI